MRCGAGFWSAAVVSAALTAMRLVGLEAASFAQAMSGVDESAASSACGIGGAYRGDFEAK